MDDLFPDSMERVKRLKRKVPKDAKILWLMHEASIALKDIEALLQIMETKS